MKLRMAAAVAIFVLAVCLPALAADISGQWTTTINSQVGDQHYVYTFKVDGEKLTGTAKSDDSTNEIQDGVVKGDDVSFTENREYQGQKLVFKYVGKISGDEIHFTRELAGFDKEVFVAKRVKQ